MYYALRITGREQFLVSGVETLMIYAKEFIATDGPFVGLGNQEDCSVEEWARLQLEQKQGFDLLSTTTGREFSADLYGDPGPERKAR